MPASEAPPAVFSDRRTAAADLRFRLLWRLGRCPEISQRRLARDLDVSLGAVHKCLRDLIARGLVAPRPLEAEPRQPVAAYDLTPAGHSAKLDLTPRFLSRKRAEHAALGAEITALEAELGEAAPRDTDTRTRPTP